MKGPFYLHPEAGPIRSCHFVALVDDHSRYLLGIRALPTKEALAILDVLGEAIELCGIPLALMSDNGTPFVAIARSMMSRFQRTLAELEIRHIRTQIDTPGPWSSQRAPLARRLRQMLPAGRPLRRRHDVLMVFRRRLEALQARVPRQATDLAMPRRSPSREG